VLQALRRSGAQVLEEHRVTVEGVSPTKNIRRYVNMKTSLKGNKLVIEVTLTKEEERRLSSTGKSRIAFSSGGFTAIGKDLKINLTVISPK
jgi:hypothetical protein